MGLGRFYCKHKSLVRVESLKIGSPIFLCWLCKACTLRSLKNNGNILAHHWDHWEIWHTSNMNHVEPRKIGGVHQRTWGNSKAMCSKRDSMKGNEFVFSIDIIWEIYGMLWWIEFHSTIEWMHFIPFIHTMEIPWDLCLLMFFLIGYHFPKQLSMDFGDLVGCSLALVWGVSSSLFPKAIRCDCHLGITSLQFV